jgi:hypothetical protein
MKKNMKLILNGFHGYQTHTVRAEIEPAGDEDGVFSVKIAESASKKFGCHAQDCCCGESMPTELTCDEWELEHKEVTVNGRYPST